MHLFYAAERGLVDDVIDPPIPGPSSSTRSAPSDERRLQPQRKHGNHPI